MNWSLVASGRTLTPQPKFEFNEIGMQWPAEPLAAL
jgi:hypothetical protein